MDFRDQLRTLAQLLHEGGGDDLAVMVEDAACGSDEALNGFLVSNNLWGGSGSIADQGGLLRDGRRTEARRKVEHALIQLGNEQIRIGLTNVRTAMCVEAFRKRETSGI